MATLDERYYKPREVAERLRVDLDRVYAAIDRGELRAVVINPQAKRRTYRIPESAAVEFLNNTSTGGKKQLIERPPVKRRFS